MTCDSKHKKLFHSLVIWNFIVRSQLKKHILPLLLIHMPYIQVLPQINGYGVVEGMKICLNACNKLIHNYFEAPWSGGRNENLFECMQ